MLSKRTTLTLALATALGLVGCSGSGSSTSQGTPVASPGAEPAVDASATSAANEAGSPHAQFLAFANAVNLRPQDMVGLTGKPKGTEHGSGLVNSVKGKAQLERCLGFGTEAKPIFKRSSEQFEASGGLHYVSVSSEVQVTRTKALADKELTIARGVLESPTKRACLAQAYDAALGGSHTIQTGGHTLRITIGDTQIAPVPVGAAATGTNGGFGISVTTDVTYAFSLRGRRFTVPGVFYIDSLNFIVGRADVGLNTTTFREPFPSEREAGLFSLLVARALNASRRSSAISQ